MELQKVLEMVNRVSKGSQSYSEVEPLKQEIVSLHRRAISQVDAAVLLNFFPQQPAVPKAQQQKVTELRDRLRRISAGLSR